MKRVIIMFVVFTSWMIGYGQTAVAPGAGDGSSGNPYQIANLDNLYWLTQNSTEWDKHYLQTMDIDATASNTWDVGDHDDNINTVEEPMGFSPIGENDLESRFSGSYNGGGYTITGLSINRIAMDYIGLFGFVQDAEITNVSLVAINFTGDDFIGGLAGYINGSNIQNCSTTGTITGDQFLGGLGGYINRSTDISNCTVEFTVTGTKYIGGFVGESFSSGRISFCQVNATIVSNYGGFSSDVAGGFIGHKIGFGTISNCSADGLISSKGYEQGGFVGLHVNGIIEECHTLMNVTNDLTFGGDIGGFAGALSPYVAHGVTYYGTINNCYARGNVNASNLTSNTGNYGVGGFVGSYETNGDNGINNSYSTGSVIVSNDYSNVGGFCGVVSNVNNRGSGNFWDIDTSGWTTSSNAAGETGKTTTEMKTKSIFTAAGWDFTGGIWDINSVVNSGYPFLARTEDETLPVTLSSFTGVFQNGSSMLQWTTQSESNNIGWNIYRSTSSDQESAMQLNNELINGAGTSQIPTNYSYNDMEELVNHNNYYYWIEDVTYGSVTHSHGPVLITVNSDIDEPNAPEVSQGIKICNYPNPFNPYTQIYFSLQENEVAEALAIYNCKGQKVYSTDMPDNPHAWNGKDLSGVDVSSGIYLYKITTNRKSYVKKMILAK